MVIMDLKILILQCCFYSFYVIKLPEYQTCEVKHLNYQTYYLRCLSNLRFDSLSVHPFDMRSHYIFQVVPLLHLLQSYILARLPESIRLVKLMRFFL